MKLSKKKATIFHTITSLDEYKQLFRKFKLNSLIKAASYKSIAIFKSKNKKINAVIEEPFLIRTNKYYSERHLLYVKAWDLIDLIYDSIKYTNDFIGSEIKSNNELLILVDALNWEKDLESETTINNMDSDDKFFLYVHGFAGEQFKFQTPSKSFSTANRELYILFECSKHIEDLTNIEELIENIMGTDWVTINSILRLLWVQSTNNPDVRLLKENIKWNTKINESIYDSLLEKYTATYEQIRTSRLKRQILYSKPYILTDRNELLCSSCYLSFFLFEHSILWILRDYFHNPAITANPFPSNFGLCFEEYFKELLSSYVAETDFYRIKEDDNKKRADWYLKLDKFKFLIEQKSSLLGLQAKQQDSNTDVIERYSKQIVQAINQLYSTEKDFNDGKYIKVILVYEDYLKPNYLDQIFNLNSFKFNNDNYYWIITIEEMEMLLNTYKYNHDVFIEIIEEKIYREIHRPSDKGRDILEIMYEKGIKDNPYVNQEKIHKYNDIIMENIKSLLKSDSQ